MDHVQKMIAKKQMKDPTFNPSECEIKSEGKLLCGTKEIQIEMKGQLPKSGTIKFSKGMVVEGKNIELDNLFYQVKDDKVSEGTKEKVVSYSDYITKVSDADNDGKVNLIMDRNICGTNDNNNGKETVEGRTCLIAWYDDGDTNTSNDTNEFGPVTAMQGLYNATKNWNNVPDMNLDYTDEGHIANSSYGYGKIETTAAGIKITKKDGTTEVTRSGNLTPVIQYETNKPLKARLPKYSEVNGAGCTITDESCPKWLTNGLEQCSSYYPSNDHISGIYGYWTLSSNRGRSDGARIVYYDGIGNYYTVTSEASHNGLRAVITVLKSDLS